VHELLNTLYVTTQGAYVHVDHDTLVVEAEGEKQLQVPVHHLGALVCFGRVMVSPVALARSAVDGRDVVFLDEHGRFQARVVGRTSGNVLLRLAQHEAFRDKEKALDIARAIVAGKMQNARLVLLREARQTEDPARQDALRKAAEDIAAGLESLPRAEDVDTVRGREGEAAAAYFRAFGHLVRADAEGFSFDGRNRRPPRDPVNAMLSFLYALLLNECTAALEGVGLDPQIGFLHAVRPGRPSLALDLMEEMRPVLGDRLALSLINRKQLTRGHFQERSGSFLLTPEGRRILLVAYQKRKAEEVQHPVAKQPTPLGLVPHVQARLLARHLRGDLAHYVPFVGR
jgi:CRISPR-associated protein Cas1